MLADTPALGLTSYAIVTGNDTGAQDGARSVEFLAPSLTIRNPCWIIQLNPHGGIQSLSSLVSGRVILKASPWLAGTVNGKPVTSAGTWHAIPASPDQHWRTMQENGTTGGIPYDAHMPFVHEEKLRFKLLPRAGAAATGVRDLPFAVAVTEEPYVQGTALDGPEHGIAYFNRGTMGSIRKQDGGFSVPLAYSMYYVWGTRILSGKYPYELSVYPFEGSCQKADLHRRALE
jgi:alpha-mannosidase